MDLLLYYKYKRITAIELSLLSLGINSTFWNHTAHVCGIENLQGMIESCFVTPQSSPISMFILRYPQSVVVWSGQASHTCAPLAQRAGLNRDLAWLAYQTWSSPRSALIFAGRSCQTNELRAAAINCLCQSTAEVVSLKKIWGGLSSSNMHILCCVFIVWTLSREFDHFSNYCVYIYMYILNYV